MHAELDLITLGAGSGGVAASRRAALHGARVAIVEGSRVGGTCVIRGCVPKKLLMYAAGFGDAMREARGYGWDVAEPHFEMTRWAAAKAAETDRLEGIYRQMLAGSGVTLVEGWARIIGPNTVHITQPSGDQTLTAGRILIATGASVVRDSIPGIETCPTSDELLDLQTLPGRAAVVGGGYIAVEFASMLARLGVQVCLYYRDRLPLRGFDEMLRTACAAELQAAGIELHPGSAPQRVQRTDAGFLLVLSEDRVIEFPWVLNATGRRPNSAGLGLDTLGIATDDAGAVPVDAHLQTAAAGVYAIGDVTNRKNLTPVAIAEGRALADTLWGGQPRSVDLNRVASAVFTLPPIASVGPSEAELLAGQVAQGRNVRVYETDFRTMKQAFIGGTERTRMKLLVDTQTDAGAGGAHDRRRCARDRAEPGGGTDRRRHQGRLRPHHRHPPDHGRGIRADARRQPCAGARHGNGLIERRRRAGRLARHLLAGTGIPVSAPMTTAAALTAVPPTEMPAPAAPEPGGDIAAWRLRVARGGAVLTALRAVRAQAESALPLHIWIHLCPAATWQQQIDTLARRLAEGGEADTALRSYPLLGVPFAVKDNIDIAGQPTTAACPAHAHSAARTATAVQRLLDAGAVWVGKTNLDQFATGLVGTRSPYGQPACASDPQRVSGGSSSGSAVALARGIVAFALGTDTAGSGRVPAGFNGLVGLKPTPGRVSSAGVLPACRTLDCVSIFSHTVADAALVLALIEGTDAADAYSAFSPGPAQLPQRLRVGVPALPTLDAAIGYPLAWDAAVARLAAQGHAAVAVDFAPLHAVAALLYDGPWVAERHAVVRRLLREQPQALDPVVRQVLAKAQGMTATDAFEAQYRLRDMQASLQTLWRDIDVLMVPTAPGHPTFAEVAADPIGSNAALGLYTNFVNLLRWCALALPAGRTARGLPFGVTFIAPADHDAALARFGLTWRGESADASWPQPQVEDSLDIAVVGAHLSGLPLNAQLTSGQLRISPALSLLQSRFVVGLGVFSYSLYLIHMPVLGVIQLGISFLHLTPLKTLVALLAIAVPICLICAYGFYQLFERRGGLRRVLTRLQGR